jgi:hypothetical protein
VPFFAIFFRSNFFWKAPFFAIFRQQQSAIFRSAKKSAIFLEKFREKQARPNSQPKTGPFFAAFRTAKSIIFRQFRFAKKVPFFAAFRSAKKSAIFREKIREKQARPNLALAKLEPSLQFTFHAKCLYDYRTVGTGCHLKN